MNTFLVLAGFFILNSAPAISSSKVCVDSNGVEQNCDCIDPPPKQGWTFVQNLCKVLKEGECGGGCEWEWESPTGGVTIGGVGCVPKGETCDCAEPPAGAVITKKSCDATPAGEDQCTRKCEWERGEGKEREIKFIGCNLISK